MIEQIFLKEWLARASKETRGLPGAGTGSLGKLIARKQLQEEPFYPTSLRSPQTRLLPRAGAVHLLQAPQLGCGREGGPRPRATAPTVLCCTADVCWRARVNPTQSSRTMQMIQCRLISLIVHLLPQCPERRPHRVKPPQLDCLWGLIKGGKTALLTALRQSEQGPVGPTHFHSALYSEWEKYLPSTQRSFDLETNMQTNKFRKQASQPNKLSGTPCISGF